MGNQPEWEPDNMDRKIDFPEEKTRGYDSSTGIHKETIFMDVKSFETKLWK